MQNLMIMLDTFINAAKNKLLTAKIIDEMMNLSVTADELTKILSQRSAINVQTEQFKKFFKTWAIEDKCENQYDAIEKISIKFEDAHDEYKSNAY